jgi:hypothetical protein
MTTPHQQILDELYEINPELRPKEPELLAAIEAMTRHRPAAALDPAFRAELRARLLEAFRAADREPAAARWLELNQLARRLWLPLAGTGAVAAVALVFAVSLAEDRPGLPSAADAPASPTAERRGWLATDAPEGIARLAARSFGPLGEVAVVHEATAPAAIGLGGATKAASDAALPRELAALTPVSPTPMTASDLLPVRHVYSYDAALALPGGEVDVLELSSALDGRAMAAPLSRLRLGDFDLGRLLDLGVEQITLTEGHDGGYSFHLNVPQGELNVSRPWPAGDETADPAGTAPSDATLIAAAEVFLKEYGFAMAGYGQPQVDGEWRLSYERARYDGHDARPPDALTVTYPLSVDGRDVVDAGGFPVGLRVAVHAGTLEVVNAGPFYLTRLAAAAYPTMADAAEFSRALAHGGPNVWQDDAADAETHALAEPSEVYLFVSRWTERGERRLLVPAWRFKLADRISEATGYWLAPAVVMPLVADLYNQPAETSATVPGLIEPLMESR